MANIRFSLSIFDGEPFTGSLSIVPTQVQVSGSNVITLDWIENNSDFYFENVAPGIYEVTASSCKIESPLWNIYVPTGSGEYNAIELIFPPVSSSILTTWFTPVALSASWASSSLSASYVKTAQSASYVQGSNVRGAVGTASLATAALSSSYALTASYAPSTPSASIAVSASYSLTASHALNVAMVDAVPSASWASSSFYSISSSFSENSAVAASASHSSTAITAVNAQTASTLVGFLYSSASAVLTQTASILIVTQRVTGSLSTATFNYSACSGSVMAKGQIEAVWVPGDIGSLKWQLDRSPAGRRISIDESGAKTETTYSSELYMSAHLGGNSIQLRAYSSSSVSWHISASAIYM